MLVCVEVIVLGVLGVVGCGGVVGAGRVSFSDVVVCLLRSVAVLSLLNWNRCRCCLFCGVVLVV